MFRALLILGAVLQVCAVAYALLLMKRRRSARGAWLWLLGGLLSMLAWRVVLLLGVHPPMYFNPLIAIWGSTCMVVAMFMFGREVARREHAESERDRLLESERSARGEAERAMRLQDDFLATLSHELRTPLASILGWAALARTARTKGEDVDRALDTIERNARAQTRLVDDLLDVTRMQAGTLHLEFAPVRLDVPVNAALASVRPAADAKNIRITVSTPSQVPSVTGDLDRLIQVASNLLTNAVKFTPRDGTVHVELAIVQGSAQLSVSDTGQGMEASFLPHLFGRFRQADSTVRRHHGGLGLGLSIVASLVRHHGGEVRAESEGPGKGSTFIVTLPLAPEGPTQGDASAPHATPLTDHVLEGIRILLVDDELDTRMAISRLLERLGASVLALESGKTIEDAIASFAPHILLLDISMPGEDGYSLIRRVRSFPAHHGGQIPAISLTAHARREDRAHAIASGFQEHLPKPVDLPALARAVRALASGHGEQGPGLDAERRTSQRAVPADDEPSGP